MPLYIYIICSEFEFVIVCERIFHLLPSIKFGQLNIFKVCTLAYFYLQVDIKAQLGQLYFHLPCCVMCVQSFGQLFPSILILLVSLFTFFWSIDSDIDRAGNLLLQLTNLIPTQYKINRLG
jgi:hypothetical protein